MSQKTSRKGVVEEKEKTDTPVKEMKKKMAANAEKEKQLTEKKEAEKPAEKATEKNDKATEKAEKVTEKGEKATEKSEKAAEKTEKPSDKKTDKLDKKAEKSSEKKPEAPAEKKEDSKDDKSAKPEKSEPKKSDAKPKQNGKDSRPVNGTNGVEENGTVSDDDDEDAMVIDEADDMFPELTYDDTSDPEFEPDAGRSFTRRSQAKVTRTPETPRPASDKQGETAADDSKDSKVLKLKEETPVSTDRKLRSSDSPKPQESKKTQDKPQESKKVSESPKTQESKDGKQESETKDQEEKENGEKTDKIEADVVIDVDGIDDEPRKTDTNYSKSRVKVSPYRRSMRIADQTTTSVMANYTGNNTTMEMDLTETTSSFISEDPSLDDSTYLSGLRSIRGRRSYKPLKEMTLRHISKQTRPANVSGSEQPARPTAPVVGRKRKPESDDSLELGAEAGSFTAAHGKRVRLLDRLSHSLRRVPAVSTPLPARRAAEIVGINTDLPLTAPVAQADAFDPEALKPDAAPAAPVPPADRDGKRCVLM